MPHLLMRVEVQYRGKNDKSVPSPKKTKMQKLKYIKMKKDYYLPMDPSQKTKKKPSLLRDKPFGN